MRVKASGAGGSGQVRHEGGRRRHGHYVREGRAFGAAGSAGPPDAGGAGRGDRAGLVGRV